MKHRMKRAAAPLAGIGAVVLVWYMVSRLGLLSAYVLPPPSKVWSSFIKMLVTGELWKDIYISYVRVMKGFSIAFVLAFLLGMVRSLLPASGRYYEFIVQFFRNVPPLSMIPLLILWCGIGEMTKTVIIVLASFFPMYLNIVKGFTGCDRKLMEVGEMFGYSKGRRSLCPGGYSGGYAYWSGIQLARDYRRRDGSGLHGIGSHDSFCPADVQNRQGNCGDSGHWNCGICDRQGFCPGNQQIIERIR